MERSVTALFLFDRTGRQIQSFVGKTDMKQLATALNKALVSLSLTELDMQFLGGTKPAVRPLLTANSGARSRTGSPIVLKKRSPLLSSDSAPFCSSIMPD